LISLLFRIIYFSAFFHTRHTLRVSRRISPELWLDLSTPLIQEAREGRVPLAPRCPAYVRRLAQRNDTAQTGVSNQLVLFLPAALGLTAYAVLSWEPRVSFLASPSPFRQRICESPARLDRAPSTPRKPLTVATDGPDHNVCRTHGSLVLQAFPPLRCRHCRYSAWRTSLTAPLVRHEALGLTEMQSALP